MSDEQIKDNLLSAGNIIKQILQTFHIVPLPKEVVDEIISIFSSEPDPERQKIVAPYITKLTNAVNSIYGETK